MLTGGFVGEFGELADQFLEYQPHLVVVDLIGMQINLGECLR
jgi:hypothetical protein